MKTVKENLPNYLIPNLLMNSMIGFLKFVIVDLVIYLFQNGLIIMYKVFVENDEKLSQA